MKFSTRIDSPLSGDEVFTAISDFPTIEGMLAARSVKAQRLGRAADGSAGIAWDLSFDHRGKQRDLRLQVVEFDRPERIVMRGGSEALDLEITMTVIALTRARSRLVFELEARPRTIRARLMLQTAKLGKAQLDRRFADRIGGFVADLTAGRG